MEKWDFLKDDIFYGGMMIRQTLEWIKEHDCRRTTQTVRLPRRIRLLAMTYDSKLYPSTFIPAAILALFLAFSKLYSIASHVLNDSAAPPPLIHMA